MMPAIAILAGGVATRLRPLTEKIPKSLVEVAGKPFIQHQMELLRKLGFKSVVLCTGFLGEQIEAFIKDGSQWGMSVRYSHDGSQLLGTGGALVKAALILGDPFWVLYGDSYLEAPVGGILDAFERSGKMGLVTVLHNENKYDKSNMHYKDGMVLKVDKSGTDPTLEYADYGLSLLRKSALKLAPQGPFDLTKIFQMLCARGELAGFEMKQRFYEIGSPKGLEETREHLEKSRLKEEL